MSTKIASRHKSLYIIAALNFRILPFVPSITVNVITIAIKSDSAGVSGAMRTVGTLKLTNNNRHLHTSPR
jgi:hypothetical protein